MLRTLFFILFFSFQIGFAQTNLDSLEKIVLQLSDQDTSKVAIYVRLAHYWHNKQLPKAIFFGENAFVLAQKHNNLRQISQIAELLAQSHKSNGNYEKAIFYFLEELKIAEKSKNTKKKIDILTEIGTLYRLQKQFPKAIANFETAIELAKKNRYWRGEANAQHHFGNLYYVQKEYEQAKECYEKSYQIREKTNEKMDMASSLNNIAKVAEKMGDAKEALRIYLKIEDFFEQSDNQEFYAVLLDNIGDAYLLLKNYEKAKSYFDKSLQIGQELDAKIIISDAYESYSNLANAQKDYQNALLHYKKYIQLNEELFSKEQSQKIASLQTEYDLERKQTEINLLQKNSQIDRLIMLGMVVLGLIFGVFALFFVRNYRRMKAFNQALNEKNVEINQQKEELYSQSEYLKTVNKQIYRQNEDTKASISYARRIQQAILPLDEEISQHFPDYFIFFQPKALVSGDFYWFYANGNQFFWVVADCTGHGVPGAFMSMLGESFLKSIVSQQQILSPEQILNQMHISIRQTLRQDSNRNEDGMDMAVCRIDRTTQMLHFSGADRPLVYFKEKQLYVLKGDKLPVGGVARGIKRYFSLHSLRLEEISHFYLFSDGFQDQFGGEHNRKFLFKNLLKLLENIHHLDMNAQKESILYAFGNWIGEYEQIDDICLLGVRLQ